MKGITMTGIGTFEAFLNFPTSIIIFIISFPLFLIAVGLAAEPDVDGAHHYRVYFQILIILITFMSFGSICLHLVDYIADLI